MLIEIESPREIIGFYSDKGEFWGFNHNWLYTKYSTAYTDTDTRVMEMINHIKRKR